MIDEYNIVITGVGGQGVITAARILSWAGLIEGYKVRGGEIHGLSQRFGSVASFVRYGSKVFGSTVPEGSANIIIALEPLESLRVIEYIKKEGYVIINTKKIPPLAVNLGNTTYPSLEEIKQIIEKDFNAKPIFINASKAAESLGDPVLENTIMIGALTRLPDFPIRISSLKEALRFVVPEKKVDINIKALQIGKNILSSQINKF